MKYLPLYYEWGKTGLLPNNGLCWSLGWPDELNGGILSPKNIGGYWGYVGNNVSGFDVVHNKELYKRVAREFTALRQNIILFLAAMAGELD